MTEKQQQKIHFVTGKGGVGKSFFAASFAESLSRAYKMRQQGNDSPILLAEINDVSFYKDYLSVNDISYQPVKTASFDLAQWRAQDCLKEYALHLLKLESLFKLFFENPISKALIDVSPGLNELAILGKATSHPRHHGPALDYSQIVFDAPSTGHFLTMFRSPKALSQTIQFGPMGEQSRSIDEWIRNSNFVEIHLVTLAEELPIAETIELYRSLKSEFSLTAKVYINKFIDINLGELKKESTEIQNYFYDIDQRQKSAMLHLENAGINFNKIPFIFETEAKKLIAEAAQSMPSLT